MEVLTALVLAAGIAASMPYLVQHGMRRVPGALNGSVNAAWRTREGALKLIATGLLRSADTETAHLDGTRDDQGARQGACAGVGDIATAGVGSSAIVRGDGEGKGTGRAGRRKEAEGAWAAEKQDIGLRRNAAVGLDQSQLVRDVGSLLEDERPEVTNSRTSKTHFGSGVAAPCDVPHPVPVQRKMPVGDNPHYSSTALVCLLPA